MDNIYLDNYILSYNNVLNILNYLISNHNNKIYEEKNTIYTAFNYNIKSYKIGKGKNHVLLIGCTHGLEIVTTYFILEFMLTILHNDDLYNELKNKFTFHFIPVLNPEGYIIVSSNLYKNYYKFPTKELEEISSKYLQLYNTDDFIASHNIYERKLFRGVIKNNVNNIDNFILRNNVCKILKKCKLNEDFLSVWAANGLGIDINSNSIHKFKEMKKLRCLQKCANLRYNDIPVTIASPMSYPGKATFKDCIENLFLYNYIYKLYNLKNLNNDEKLIAIFSYHSTGGEIYGYPDINSTNKEQLDLHISGMLEYSKYTRYSLINEELKYGVMDYYRTKLNNVLTLTIELSRLNANPIGPFSNIQNFNNEIISNKKAVIHTINSLINKNKQQ